MRAITARKNFLWGNPNTNNHNPRPNYWFFSIFEKTKTAPSESAFSLSFFVFYPLVSSGPHLRRRSPWCLGGIPIIIPVWRGPTMAMEVVHRLPIVRISNQVVGLVLFLLVVLLVGGAEGSVLAPPPFNSSWEEWLEKMPLPLKKDFQIYINEGFDFYFSAFVFFLWFSLFFFLS